MRIAFIGQKGFPATWGGVEVHVDALATRMAAMGHEVSVYVRRWYSPGGPDEIAGVRRIALPTLRGKHLDAAVHSALGAAHAAGRGFDVVHFHALGPALFTAIPRIAGAAIVTTVHGRDYLRDKWGPVARLSLRLGEELALRASHRVITVSRELAEGYRARGHDAVYIPNGVDIGPGPLVAPAPERPFLLFLGRWVPEKRVAELVTAFAARERGVDLVVAGAADDPGYERAVRGAAAGCSQVRFPGMVTGDDKHQLLAAASGFVTSSALEGLPIALLEALAAGIPCAASDIPPHREVLETLDPDALYPAGDIDAALSRLERVALTDTGDGAAAAFRHGIAEAIAGTYSWERCAREVESIYRSLA